MSTLQPLDDDLWMADGPEVSFFGVPYPTRMVLIRLPEGLWVWSPTALDAGLREAVAALGTVRWIVSPNKIHHLFIPEWLEAFPEATAWAPPGLAARRTDIAFAGELTGALPWSGIEQVVVGGSFVMEEVIFFHRASSTCLVGDLIQRHDPDHFEGWTRAVMKLDGLAGPDGSTPREWRATFLNRTAARQALDTAVGWAPRRVIIAHGTCAMEDGARLLAENLDWIRHPWPV